MTTQLGGLHFMGGKLNWQTAAVTMIFFGTALAQILPQSNICMIGYEASGLKFFSFGPVSVLVSAPRETHAGLF